MESFRAGALGSLSRVSHRLFHLTGLERWIWEGPFALKEIKTCVLFSSIKTLFFFMITGGPFGTRTVITRQRCTFSTVQCPGLLMSNCYIAMDKRGSRHWDHCLKKIHTLTRPATAGTTSSSWQYTFHFWNSDLGPCPWVPTLLENLVFSAF